MDDLVKRKVEGGKDQYINKRKKMAVNCHDTVNIKEI